MDSPNKKKRYITFDPSAGYPAGANLYYECLSCGQTIPSRPTESLECKCGNIAIDTGYGRLDINNHNAARLFEIEDDKE